GCRVPPRGRAALRGPRDSGGYPKGLAGGEGRGRRTQGRGGSGESLGEAHHALPPAGADRPVRGDPDAHRDPWAGDAEDWSGEGTVAMARAWAVRRRLSH